MRGALILFVLAVLAAPVAAEDDVDIDIPGLDAADLRGDALVWEDATFYLEPWETGANVSFARFGRGRREEVGRAIPVRIVDSKMRSFVEIELPGRADCTFRKLDADARITGLRLYVRRDDLAPALVKPFFIQYADGTKIKLAIGAPVSPTSTGDYLVSAKLDKLRLPIPHGSVGYLYKAGKITEPELPKGKLVRVDRNTSVKLGDDAIPIRSNWLAPAPAKKPPEVTLLSWTTRCVEMVVSVPSNTVRPVDPVRPSTPARTLEVSARVPYILPGAPLSTPTGREVAVASAPIPVTTPATGPACFDAKLALVHEDEGYGTSRTIKLCAPSSALQR